MFRKTFIALAATAAIAAGMSASAQAKTHINLNLGFGGYGYGCGYACDPGFGGGYGGVGFYDGGGDCGWQWVNVKKWSNYYHNFVIKHKKVWSCY
jgi:hypothetical protein